MVNISLIGLPTDANSSFERGAALAPPVIRAALFSDRGNLASELGPEIGIDIALADAGDIAVPEGQPGHDAIRTAIAGLDAVPIALGGDHAVTFPVVQALAARHGPLSILHFDAHPDLYDDFGGNPLSHASPFARIMEAGLATRLVQIGVRTLNTHCREQADRFGVEIVPMAGFDARTAPVLAGPLYVSIDMDGIDPSEAPGVSHPEPGGLTVREVLTVLHGQTAPVVGADIVELNPNRDPSGVTGILAAKLVRELAALIARNAQ